jgi:hypothetical protein
MPLHSNVGLNICTYLFYQGDVPNLWRNLIMKEGEKEMSYTCYYCDHHTENAHSVTFYQADTERMELLCDDCYEEWLLSLRG